MARNDIRQLNRIIFGHGNIQVSPQHVQMLNNKDPVPFIPMGKHQPPSTGFQVLLTGYASHIFTSERTKNHFVRLDIAINQLRALPRPAFDGYQKTGSVDTRLIKTQFFNIWYKIHSGQVLVFNIEAVDAVQRERARQEKPAMYNVRKEGPVWQLIGETNAVSTPYAAVNGQSNNLAKATWLMGLHLEAEFGKNRIKDFTLFHNPSVGAAGDTWESMQDKLGFTTPVTREFSKILQDVQQSGKDVKWIAHSQGGVIFAEGVRFFLNGNHSSALRGANGLFKDKEKASLNKNSVAFHGNANNNYRSKFLLERAGIEVIDIRGSDYDFVYNMVGMNAENGWSVLRSLVYANHVISGSVKQSPHTLEQSANAWCNNMTSGPGNGRNALQRGYEHAEAFVVTHQHLVTYIPNYLI